MSERTCRVSVCIPAYNGEAFLAACLDSVLAQSCRDFELLIVDDASTDGTPELVATYAARDPRIRSERNERNRGLVGNWNHCASIARGEWIKFVFQDDLLAPSCLERLLAAAQGGRPLVSCARDFIFEPGVHPDSRRSFTTKKANVARIFARRPQLTPAEFCEVVLDNPGQNLIGEPTAVLLHRSAFERCGPFNADFITYCDAEYWVRVGIHAGVVHVAEELATFRVHPAATSHANTRDHNFRADALDKLLMRHEMAFHPTYAPLRAAASRRAPPLDLEQAYWEEAYWTLRRARHEARAGDGLPLADLEALAQRYPRIGCVPLRFRVARLARALARRAGGVRRPSAARR